MQAVGYITNDTVRALNRDQWHTSETGLEPDAICPGLRRTRVAGIFLFLPLLARLRFDQLVQQAGYPGFP
jgi:hypothetical protein